MSHSNKSAAGSSIARRDAEGARAVPVASFEIHYTQILDQNGELQAALPEFAHDPSKLIELYRAMVATRLFDQKAIALQRTGQLGTYASALGQEATFTGVGMAMRTEDVLLPTYRECGAMFARGVTMTELLRYWGGDERGMDYAGPREDFPVCIPIATHVPHAAGVAYAMKLRRQPRVAVCTLGDGATSKGDFYEAINLAGVLQLPMVIVVCNNQWAISVPRSKQSRAQTLAQKAIAAAIDGEQVDGDDVIAVYDRMQAALAKARSGRGPTLIEALSYRMGDHTTADDARRYRSEQELEEQRKLDPIKRLRIYLERSGHWTAQDEETLSAERSAEIEAAVKEYLALPPPAPESMFDFLYETLPAAYAEQRALSKRRNEDA
jgi:2-oxoisovalerate dehydrogenase E1 component subunit alpha